MAKPLPDFTDTTLFPTFLTIPQDDQDQGPPSSNNNTTTSSQDQQDWYLLAQVKDNMTINKPTLVLTDRDANPFALVFEGLGRDDLDLRALGFKKGCTALVPRARRTKPADESKRGFVRVDKAHAAAVKAVPAPLARVLEVAAAKTKGMRCATCGKGAGSEGGEDGSTVLKSCTGCGRVGYCTKVSFGWALFFVLYYYCSWQ